MLYNIISLRTTSLLLLCCFLASCNQATSGVSTFNGNLSADKQSAKIAAARKRAALKRKARKSEFNKERAKRRSAKKATFTNRYDKSKSAKRAKRKSSKRVTVTSRSIKGTSYAYIGGRSRGINKKAPWRCVPKKLKIVLNQVSKKFGKVVINSTHRSRRHNRRVGGKRRSYHLRCQAVDFRVVGRTRGLTRWLARHPYVGGYNRYPSGYYHIDTGPKRTW